MPNSKERLAVHGPDNEILQYVSEDTGNRLVRNGLAYIVGNGRALLARRAYIPILRAAKPQSGHTYYTHRFETEDNPAGVWTFNKRSLIEA